MSRHIRLGSNSAFKNTVFGFVRALEKSECIVVPNVLKYLVLKHYLLEDAFTESSGKVRLENSDKRAIYTNTSLAATFLSVARKDSYAACRIELGHLNEGIAEYEWTLRVRLSMGNITLGLTSDAKGEIEPFKISGIQTVADDWSKVTDTDQGPTEWKSGEVLADNIIQMKLDMVREELSFHVDGKFLCKLDHSNGFKMAKYRLVVVLGGDLMFGAQHPDSAELIKFSIKHY